MENIENSAFVKIRRQAPKYFQKKPKIANFSMKLPKGGSKQVEDKFQWKENYIKQVSGTAHKKILFPDGGQNVLRGQNYDP